MKVIDFTTNSWGHALHSFTFYEVKDYGSFLSRWVDKLRNRRRYSVMVHCQEVPRVGFKVRLLTESGIQEPTIYDIKYCRDPKDMYTIFLLYENKVKEVVLMAKKKAPAKK
jgi:hypothetical protein